MCPVRIRSCLFTTMVALFCAVTVSFGQAKFAGKVIEVIDGRTVQVETSAGRVTVQLQYIEVPKADEPYGSLVRSHLANLTQGKLVEFQPVRINELTTVGRLTINGIDLSLQLLRDGAARHEPADRSGQAPDQAAEYAYNQQKAREEKRGIWAAVAAVQQSVRFSPGESSGGMRHDLDKWSVFLKPVAPASAGSRANRPASDAQASGRSAIWPDANVNAAQDFLGNYDLATREGFTATPIGAAKLLGPRSAAELGFRVVFVYRGEPNAIEERAFILTFLSESDDLKFDGRNELSLIADKQNLYIGNAKRLYRRNERGVQELLLYSVSRSTLEKMITARTLGFRLPRSSGTIDTRIQPSLKQLLELSN